MKQHTELEKKLFEYIIYLLSIINIYTHSMNTVYNNLAKIFGWQNDNFKQMDRNVKIEEILNYLNNEFEWNFESKPEQENEDEDNGD